MEKKFRVVPAEIAEMRIVEDEEYVYSLARKIDGGLQQMFLWEVTVMCMDTNTGEVVHCDKIHILADSKGGAESQASCVFYKEHQNACHETQQNHCYATRIPFGIRGWSGHQF